jgi:hypothetical protein
VFEPRAIVKWIDDEDDVTAKCPECGIDSVIGDASGFPADDPVFLRAMKRRWFES